MARLRKLSQADYVNGLNWMTNKRGKPNQVVTKYPQPLPVVTEITGERGRHQQKRVFVRALADVDFIEPIAGGYTVHYHALDGDKDLHPAATTVILAAGCLGSRDLLMRSRDETNGKLPLSRKIGENFPTNGDFSGFVVVDRDKLQ